MEWVKAKTRPHERTAPCVRHMIGTAASLRSQGSSQQELRSRSRGLLAGDLGLTKIANCNSETWWQKQSRRSFPDMRHARASVPECVANCVSMKILLSSSAFGHGKTAWQYSEFGNLKLTHATKFRHLRCLKSMVQRVPLKN